MKKKNKLHIKRANTLRKSGDQITSQYLDESQMMQILQLKRDDDQQFHEVNVNLKRSHVIPGLKGNQKAPIEDVSDIQLISQKQHIFSKIPIYDGALIAEEAQSPPFGESFRPSIVTACNNALMDDSTISPTFGKRQLSNSNSSSVNHDSRFLKHTKLHFINSPEYQVNSPGYFMNPPDIDQKFRKHSIIHVQNSPEIPEIQLSRQITDQQTKAMNRINSIILDKARESSTSIRSPMGPKISFMPASDVQIKNQQHKRNVIIENSPEKSRETSKESRDVENQQYKELSCVQQSLFDSFSNRPRENTDKKLGSIKTGLTKKYVNMSKQIDQNLSINNIIEKPQPFPVTFLPTDKVLSPMSSITPLSALMKQPKLKQIDENENFPSLDKSEKQMLSINDEVTDRPSQFSNQFIHKSKYSKNPSTINLIQRSSDQKSEIDQFVITNSRLQTGQTFPIQHNNTIYDKGPVFSNIQIANGSQSNWMLLKSNNEIFAPNTQRGSSMSSNSVESKKTKQSSKKRLEVHLNISNKKERVLITDSSPNLIKKETFKKSPPREELIKNFFGKKNEYLQKIKERLLKDYSNFIEKDTEWLNKKDDSGKITMPAYSHVYKQKAPSQPLNNLIYKKIQKYQEEKLKQKIDHQKSFENTRDSIISNYIEKKITVRNPQTNVSSPMHSESAGFLVHNKLILNASPARENPSPPPQASDYHHQTSLLLPSDIVDQSAKSLYRRNNYNETMTMITTHNQSPALATRVTPNQEDALVKMELQIISKKTKLQKKSIREIQIQTKKEQGMKRNSLPSNVSSKQVELKECQLNLNEDIVKSLEKWTLSKSGIKFNNKKNPKPPTRNYYNRKSLVEYDFKTEQPAATINKSVKNISILQKLPFISPKRPIMFLSPQNVSSTQHIFEPSPPKTPRLGYTDPYTPWRNTGQSFSPTVKIESVNDSQRIQPILLESNGVQTTSPLISSEISPSERKKKPKQKKNQNSATPMQMTQLLSEINKDIKMQKVVRERKKMKNSPTVSETKLQKLIMFNQNNNAPQQSVVNLPQKSQVRLTTDSPLLSVTENTLENIKSEQFNNLNTTMKPLVHIYSHNKDYISKADEYLAQRLTSKTQRDQSYQHSKQSDNLQQRIQNLTFQKQNQTFKVLKDVIRSSPNKLISVTFDSSNSKPSSRNNKKIVYGNHWSFQSPINNKTLFINSTPPEKDLRQKVPKVSVKKQKQLFTPKMEQVISEDDQTQFVGSESRQCSVIKLPNLD